MTVISSEEMLKQAWDIAGRLKAANISHELQVYRFDAVSILAHVPGEYWEIDVCDGGWVDVEIYKSTGIESDAKAAMERLISENND